MVIFCSQAIKEWLKTDAQRLQRMNSSSGSWVCSSNETVSSIQTHILYIYQLERGMASVKAIKISIMAGVLKTKECRINKTYHIKANTCLKYSGPEHYFPDTFLEYPRAEDADQSIFSKGGKNRMQSLIRKSQLQMDTPATPLRRKPGSSWKRDRFTVRYVTLSDSVTAPNPTAHDKTNLFYKGCLLQRHT